MSFKTITKVDLIVFFILVIVSLGFFFLSPSMKENAKQFCRSKGYVDVYEYKSKGLSLDEVICLDENQSIYLYEEVNKS